MGNIIVEIEGFSDDYASLNGIRELKVSRRAILRASLTLGFQSFGDLMSVPGRQWLYRFIQGCSCLSCLTKTDHGWSGHEFRDNLDSSEKSQLSYWQGMIFAKLIADKYLSVPWLANVDNLIASGTVVTTKGTKERGDLVGKCHQDRWHVVEAKGRSNPYSSDLIEKAKQQASQIVSVSGQTPATHVACITSLWEDPIKIVFADPPPDGDVSIDFSEETFWENYYGGLGGYIREFKEVTEITKPFRGYTFASLKHLFAEFPDEKVLEMAPLPTEIGLPDSILEKPSSALQVINEIVEDGQPIEGDGVLLLGPFGNIKELEYQS